MTIKEMTEILKILSAHLDFAFQMSQAYLRESKTILNLQQKLTILETPSLVSVKSSTPHS